MAEFTPITTQEQLDALIGDRLKRERETISKRYSDYDTLKTKVADYEKQIGDLTRAAEDAAKKYAGYDQQMSELQSRVKGYETASVKTRIAHETGLPYELAGRLSGDSEEDIRKDAEGLAKLLGSSRQAPPPRKDSEGGADGKRSALRALSAQLAEAD